MPRPNRRPLAATVTLARVIVAGLALCGLNAACMGATASRNIWMTATMDGRKVGFMHYQRKSAQGRITTLSTLQIQFQLRGTPLKIHNEVREVESDRGRPLAFSADTHMSSDTTRTVGTLDGPHWFLVRSRTGDSTRSSHMFLPGNVLFENGVRKAIVTHGFTPGTHYVLHRFNSSSQSVSMLDIKVVGPQTIDLPGRTMRLNHLQQSRRHARASNVTDLWVDARGDVYRIGMHLLGFRLEFLACSETCAKEPEQSVSVLKRAMVMSPRPLSFGERQTPIRFLFSVHDPDNSPFIDTDMQSTRRTGDTLWEVDTVPLRKGVEPPPTESDLAANDWLQSDDPQIKALATKAVGHVTRGDRRMRRMTQFVRQFITRQGDSIGYASALETARSRQGDCTEYAVLLAAMARSQHIPSRVVTGLVYAGHYDGKNGVMVPHTWVQAWVDGAWKEYDAAMPRYDRTHVAMAYGDGDPWKYYAGINNLGRIDLRQVIPGGVGEGR